MTTQGEEAVRRALKESLEMNRVEVHLAQETTRVIRQDIRHELRSLVNELLETHKNRPGCRFCANRR